jgi:hypothetical protein
MKKRGFTIIVGLIIAGVISLAIVSGHFMRKCLKSFPKPNIRGQYVKAGHFEDKVYGFSFYLPVACYIHKTELKKPSPNPLGVTVISGLFSKSRGLEDFLRELTFWKGKQPQSIDVIASFKVYYNAYLSQTDPASYVKQVLNLLNEKFGDIEILEEKVTKNGDNITILQVYRQIQKFPDVWRISTSNDDLLFEATAMMGFRKAIVLQRKAYAIDVQVVAIGEGKPKRGNIEEWKKLLELKEKRQPKLLAKQAGTIEWMATQPFQNPSLDEVELLDKLSSEFAILKNKTLKTLESSNEIKWSRQLTESFRVFY